MHHYMIYSKLGVLAHDYPNFMFIMLSIKQNKKKSSMKKIKTPYFLL